MNGKKEGQNPSKWIGTAFMIPFLLGVPPIMGALIGRWLDDLLHTAPYLMYILIFLGMIAGFREIIRLVKGIGNGF